MAEYSSGYNIQKLKTDGILNAEEYQNSEIFLLENPSC